MGALGLPPPQVWMELSDPGHLKSSSEMGTLKYIAENCRSVHIPSIPPFSVPVRGAFDYPSMFIFSLSLVYLACSHHLIILSTYKLSRLRFHPDSAARPLAGVLTGQFLSGPLRLTVSLHPLLGLLIDWDMNLLHFFTSQVR